jgi:hypothetical protein
MPNPIAHLRTEPHPDKPGATDVEAMNARVEAMEILYKLSGRDQRGHAMHSLYTGLAEPSPF